MALDMLPPRAARGYGRASRAAGAAGWKPAVSMKLRADGSAQRVACVGGEFLTGGFRRPRIPAPRGHGRARAPQAPRAGSPRL